MIEFDFSLTEDSKIKVNETIKRVPKNEDELKRYFFKLEEVFGFTDVRLYATYPDASAFYKGVEINIEFELNSSNFKKHKHDISRCDLVVCWENDEPNLKLPKLELSTLYNNWLELRNKAMQEFMVLNMVFKKENETREDIANKMKSLMDIYNFDREEAIAYYMGMTKRGFHETYGSIYKDPEYIGGSLECVKKDLDAKHLNLEFDLKGVVPVVVCCECQNSNECRYGRDNPIGFYFIILNDDERPRRIKFRKFPLQNKDCLEYCTEPPFNVWSTIRFNRY